MTLQPSIPGVPQEPLPYIHFLPAENFTAPKEDYQCPLYRTNVRAGVLSTTVSSTGMVHCCIPALDWPSFSDRLLVLSGRECKLRAGDLVPDAAGVRAELLCAAGDRLND